MSETLVNPPIARETRIAMYELQYRLRVFEKRAYDLFLQNLVKGTSHLALGQEAVAAGFATRCGAMTGRFARIAATIIRSRAASAC